MNIDASNHSMTGGGANVIVCVLDDGVEPIGNLTGRAYAVNYSSKAGVNRQGSHGTAVASVVIDHCPEAIIYSYNIRDTGYQVDAIHAALADILARAKSDTRRYIVNMSFAGDGNTSNASIAEMERRVNLLVEANVPVVVGAGNDGEDVTGNKWPSCFREVICVSALKNDGTRAQFSAWHNEVDFGELGDPVQALDINGAMRGMAGTSFATPIVAAKCATLLSRYPNMTEPELYEVLKANAQDIADAGFDPYTGWGWIAGLEVAAVTPGTDLKPETPNKEDVMTAAQLIAYFQRAVDEGWGYVWSLNGELYTREKAEYYHKIQKPTNSNRDPKTYWLTVCAKWIGKMAADCSGGIVGAIRTVIPGYDDRNANTFYAQCTEKGPIKTIPEIHGLCVWRDGHIGIYEGNGNVLEFRGTDYGAVRTKLKDRSFTHWGKLRDIKYDTEDMDMAKVITSQSPLMRGEDIKALQAALNGLGYDCGTADGVAGAKTMSGIQAFCAAHGASTTIEVPAELPGVLTLAVEVGGKKYSLDIQAK